MARDAAPLRRPPPVGRRGVLLLALAAAGALAWAMLGLGVDGLLPRGGGAAIAGDFFSAALDPAFDYQDAPPPGTAPFGRRILDAVARTVAFAAAAMSLSLVFGLLLGVLAADAWWTRRAHAGRVLQWGVRLLAAAMRSVHELLWAVLFLAAFGLSPATAVLAISLPYAGTLAKVFSEMLDEAPDSASEALRGLGAPPAQRFLFGLLPAALPDMMAYAFYRFECAVRSSAILGFFGFETLGLYVKQSFENLHYREVWAYLYALLALVLVLEAWSGRLRRRFVA